MPVSTHVLDAAGGRPAVGLRVALERRLGAGWDRIAEAGTDDDGRVPGLPVAEPGVYRLCFDIEAWAGADCFYPEVMIAFRITDAGASHHVPLLLSPFAYSTYRGS